MPQNNDKIKVLCVEDEIDIRESIAEVIRDEGYEVLEAEDAEQGYETFLKEEPNIIISDIKMPGMSGFDFLKKVRSSDKKIGKNIPFIFLTALSNKKDIIEGTKLSANDYLIKPVDFDILIAKIKEKVSTSQQIEQNHQEDIENILSQLSSLLPNDFNAHLDLMTKMTSMLKEEPFGPLGHRKYYQMINKIHMIAVKMKSMVENSLSKETIAENIDVSDRVIDAKDLSIKVINKFLSQDKNKKIALEIYDDNLPKIKCDTNTIGRVLFNIIKQLALITTDEYELKFNIFIDHFDRFIFTVHGVLSGEPNTQNIQRLTDELNKVITKQGGEVEFEVRGDELVILTSLPSYRIVR